MDKPAIPAGMVEWGPDSPGYPKAPADWDGKTWMMRDGTVADWRPMRWHNDPNKRFRGSDLVAYTPRTPPDHIAGAGEEIGALRARAAEQENGSAMHAVGEG